MLSHIDNRDNRIRTREKYNNSVFGTQTVCYIIITSKHFKYLHFGISEGFIYFQQKRLFSKKQYVLNCVWTKIPYTFQTKLSRQRLELHISNQKRSPLGQLQQIAGLKKTTPRSNWETKIQILSGKQSYKPWNWTYCETLVRIGSYFCLRELFHCISSRIAVPTWLYLRTDGFVIF